MPIDRADISTDGLIKILLILVVIWLALEVFTEILGLLLAPFFGSLQPIIGLIVLVILVLWLLGKL